MLCNKSRGLFCLTGILIILMFVNPSSIAMACDCNIPKNANEALEKAAAVFRGEVLQLTEEKINGESYSVALISVSEIWKGIEESQVRVYTEKGSSCQFDFEVGKEYLLYSYEYNGMLKVINCSRCAEVKYANQDLLELGKGKEPVNTVQLEEDLKSNKLFNQTSILLLLLIIVFVTVYLWRKKIKK
ncbi:hypothetical protein F7731_14705 [Cytobacillus depressus]|uniref:Cobalamin biosynthesis protein CbiN n=1 Tax=Cytobacillus depressus TaxID=1602942 RepID=A0A6L3V4S9_9BACI|nr:hypothetical protein [Cytobacillus depressus]KAB2334462.1 hypothetical protein F7731_14705 [Cytobacillus depressus]